MLPIVMTTYTANNDIARLKYFKNAVLSIEQSSADTGNMIIVDDCSEHAEKLELLTELEKKYTIIRNKHRGGTFSTTRIALDYCYDNFDDDFFVYIQDDTIVSRNWLERAIEASNEVANNDPDFAILSIFRHNRFKDDKFVGNFYKMEHGHPSAIAWVISRKGYGVYLDKYRAFDSFELHRSVVGNEKTMRPHLCDYKICHCMRLLNLSIYCLKQSLVQHKGTHSSLSRRNYARFESKYYVG